MVMYYHLNAHENWSYLLRGNGIQLPRIQAALPLSPCWEAQRGPVASLSP